MLNRIYFPIILLANPYSLLKFYFWPWQIFLSARQHISIHYYHSKRILLHSLHFLLHRHCYRSFRLFARSNRFRIINTARQRRRRRRWRQRRLGILHLRNSIFSLVSKSPQIILMTSCPCVSWMKYFRI